MLSGGVEGWEEETICMIVEKDMIDHPSLNDGSVSRACVDLVKRMLRKGPADRLNAASCLEDKWFSEAEKPVPTLSVGACAKQLVSHTLPLQRNN